MNCSKSESGSRFLEVAEGVMIVKRKTRKAIKKSVKKVIKKHGPKVVAGLAGSIASTLATLASTEAVGSKGRKSNLTALSKRVTDTFTGESDVKSRRKGRSGKRGDGKSGKRGQRRRQGAEPLEETV
jgi:hypothetical protein